MHYRILTLTFFSLFFSCQTEEKGIQPAYQSLTESVYASATLQPKDAYQVYAGVNGILDNVLLEEGQIVKKDQVLARILHSNPSVRTDKAQLQAQLAKENYSGTTNALKSILDEITAAQLKLQADSLNFDRQKRLWAQNIGTALEYDNRKLAFELSLNTLKTLEKKHARTKNELAIQVQLAEKELQSTQITQNDYLVRAKNDGKIYALFKESGEHISVQEPLAILGHPKQFIIEMEVDEIDIAKIKINQNVALSLDAYSTKVFEATVSKIYPQKELRTQTFKIEGVFKEAPPTLYPGLSGEANIIISMDKQVLTIPIEYLTESNVKSKEGWITVQTGRKTMDFVEILSGIDTSTLLLKPQ